MHGVYRAPHIPLNGWVQFNIHVVSYNALCYRISLVNNTGTVYVVLHTTGRIDSSNQDNPRFARRSVFSISEVCPWNTFEELVQSPNVVLQHATEESLLGSATSLTTFDALKHEVQNLILEHSL